MLPQTGNGPLPVKDRAGDRSGRCRDKEREEDEDEAEEMEATPEKDMKRRIHK